eukprot:gene28250-26193_t
MFMYDLLGPQPRIVSGRSVMEMSQFGPGELMKETTYGLGIWRADSLSLTRHPGFHVNTSFPGIWPHVTYMGHAGDDYGTISRQGYHPSLGFGFSMMINKQIGDYPMAPTDMHAVFCVTWRAVFRVLLADELPGVEHAFR